MIVHITKSKTESVATFADAVRAVTAHWSSRTATAYYRDAKAGIITRDGVGVAHVSYNGRVWEGVDRNAVGAKELGYGS